MLLLPKGQRGEGRESSLNNNLSEVGEYWAEKYFNLPALEQFDQIFPRS